MPMAQRQGRECADCLGNRRLERRLFLRRAKKHAFHGRGKLLLVGFTDRFTAKVYEGTMEVDTQDTGPAYIRMWLRRFRLATEEHSLFGTS